MICLLQVTGDMIDSLIFSPRNGPTTTTHYMPLIRRVINVPFSKDDALVFT